MREKIFIIFLSCLSSMLFAQQRISISAIQGSGNSSPYAGQTVTTTGVVTAKYIGSGMINGFFLQDEIGDGNPNTSDGIFVYTTTDNIDIGNKIELTAKVSEYYNRTQLSGITNLSIIAQHVTIQPLKIRHDIYNWNWEKYEGMLVEFDQTLWVNNNYYLEMYGELELGIKRKSIPTDITFPNTTEYTALVNENALMPIYLDDAYTSNYKTPIEFADENGTRRLGERVTNLVAVVDYINDKYVVYPAQSPVLFYGNPRIRTHGDIGKYNLKVCGFNLEYYLTSPNNNGYGPQSQAELNMQHIKILDALLAIDADIYGLVEIEQGQKALAKLAQAMNSATNTSNYSYIDDEGSINGSYTKVGYLYRQDKVSPYKSLKNINSPTPINRKKQQGFTLNTNNERFIFSINHFKAKSGCGSATGNDRDIGDGQSCYNATRVKEAEAVVSAAKSNIAFYDDDDVLIMGDLNAYAKEYPIQVFINNGYVNLLEKYQNDTAYSFVYRDEAGSLDHALSSSSLAKQVTGATVFHINSDELSIYGYDGTKAESNMFRCSDHDPVIVGIALSNNSSNAWLPVDESVKIYPSIVNQYLRIDEANGAYIQLHTLNGIKIYQGRIDASNYEFDVHQSGINSGTYIVSILIENRIVKKLIFIK